MSRFMEALKQQRWDDHRYYHHSRINQSLHFISALSFLYAYGLFFSDPIGAALIGWLFSMSTRQAGHFFFEPKGYDHVNQASHEHKENIKVGYNLERKVVLIAIWASAPLLNAISADLFGLLPESVVSQGYLRSVGALWLVLGIAGLLFRTVHLFFIRDVQTGLVWMAKILSDPFHDALLYRKAPLQLLRGEMIDPQHGQHA